MTYPKVSFDPTDSAGAAGVPASPRFPEIEERVLRYWDEDGTFLASVENRTSGKDGDNEFVFYDGPPFANGLPHYGHLLTGYVKDLIPRYQTMRGRRVERRLFRKRRDVRLNLLGLGFLGRRTREAVAVLGHEGFSLVSVMAACACRLV